MKKKLLFIFLVAAVLAGLAIGACAGELEFTQNGSSGIFEHSKPIRVTYDLSAYEFDRAELCAEARYNNHYYTYEPIQLTWKKGGYDFTETSIGDFTAFRVRLYDAEGSFLNEIYGGQVAYTGSWSGHPSTPQITVTPGQTAVTAGTPISADYQITGGTGNYNRCEVNWFVYRNNDYVTSTSNYMTASSGTLTLDEPMALGTHYVFATVEDSNGWTFQLTKRENGIEVTTDATNTPLSIEMNWTDGQGNALDWSKDKARQNQEINVEWTMHGGYTPYEGYLSMTTVSGPPTFISMGMAGASRSFSFSVYGNEDVELQVEYHDNHNNSASFTVTIPLMPELTVEAVFTGDTLRAGKPPAWNGASAAEADPIRTYRWNGTRRKAASES